MSRMWIWPCSCDASSSTIVDTIASRRLLWAWVRRGPTVAGASIGRLPLWRHEMANAVLLKLATGGSRQIAIVDVPAA